MTAPAPDAPLRIALVAPDCKRHDGQGRYVAELCEQLAGFGHAVTVASVGFEDVDPARVRHLKLQAPPRATRLRFFTMLATARRVRRSDFDVIHALGASHPRPDVVTAQFVQAAWDEVAAREAPPELRGGALDRLARRAVSAVERHVFSRPEARAVIAVSRRVARDINRFCGERDGLTVLPQGVDLEGFHPRLRARRAEVLGALGVDPAAFVALFMGEFERKNLVTAIAAMTRVRDRRVLLLAAGGSPPERYRRLAEERGVAGRVRFAPRTREPGALMAAADAFVFPSLYDPFGTVTLEAAACGTPVVTTARVGFAEWISDGCEGYVHEDPFDEALIADRLDRLAGDDAAARRMGAAGRALAEQFPWDGVARRTEAIYRQLLAERARGSSAPVSLRPELARPGSSPPVWP